MTHNRHQRHRTCGLGGKRTLLRIAFAQIALGVVLIGTLATASIFDIRGNASPSEPLGIYRLTHEPLTRGAFVVLKLPLKKIAALPGDTVRVTPAGSYVNGKLWPHSAIPTGAPNHFPFGTYQLHPNQIWVLGDHPLSYDSRYFGMIPESLVNATAKPLLITENNHD
jgi:signal peptidase I/conjugal transfer pilin signal peptidase TrbI